MTRNRYEIVHLLGAIRRLAVVAIAFAALAPTGVATAEEIDSVPWDQQAVSEIAETLTESLKGIEAALRNEPGNMMPTGDRRSRYAVKQDVRRLRREGQHLANETASGQGMEETLNIFLKVQELAHAAAENGRRAALTKPTLDRVAEAREQLTKLAPYYGETWTPVMTTP